MKAIPYTTQYSDSPWDLTGSLLRASPHPPILSRWNQQGSPKRGVTPWGEGWQEAPAGLTAWTFVAFAPKDPSPHQCWPQLTELPYVPRDAVITAVRPSPRGSSHCCALSLGSGSPDPSLLWDQNCCCPDPCSWVPSHGFDPSLLGPPCCCSAPHLRSYCFSECTRAQGHRYCDSSKGNWPQDPSSTVTLSISAPHLVSRGMHLGQNFLPRATKGKREDPSSPHVSGPQQP